MHIYASHLLHFLHFGNLFLSAVFPLSDKLHCSKTRNVKLIFNGNLTKTYLRLIHSHLMKTQYKI